MHQNRRSSFEYEDLIACGHGELFGPGNARPAAVAADADVRPHQRASTRMAAPMARASLPVAELRCEARSLVSKCHFVGDPVMPGCLGLDAVWQLLGFYLGWTGASGSGRALGVGEVKFSGQELPTVRLVSYHINVKRLVLRSKLVLGVADGCAHGGRILYDAFDIGVGLLRDVDLQSRRPERKLHAGHSGGRAGYLGAAGARPLKARGRQVMRRVVVTGIGIISCIGNNTRRKCSHPCGKAKAASKSRPSSYVETSASAATSPGRADRSTPGSKPSIAARCAASWAMARHTTTLPWNRRSATSGLPRRATSSMSAPG